MKKEIKNNVSLKSQLCDTSYCSVKSITLSSMPLGWGFYFRSIQPFNFVSDFIEIKQLKEAFNSLLLVTNTELIFKLIKSMYRAMLLV